MASNHDKPSLVPPKNIFGNTNKGPQPTQSRVDASHPRQASGAGVPGPGTYPPGTGPTVRPEFTGRHMTGNSIDEKTAK